MPPTFIQAANNTFDPCPAGIDLRPRNCHEAVLGWLLMSLGYPRPWRLLRVAAIRPNHGVGPNTLSIQFQNRWMWENIYQPTTQIWPANMNVVQAGDVLCSGILGCPTHSMAVVSVRPGQVNIRGFNNDGTFQRGPHMEYDNIDRNVAIVDPNDPAKIWNVTNNHPNTFGYGTAALFVTHGPAARQNVAHAFPWERSAIPVTVGERWHYNAIQGWRWY